MPLIARVVLGWRHAFGDLTPGSVLAFEAGGPNFEVLGAPLNQNAVLAAAGLDYRATNNLTVGISYSGQAGERAYDNAVKGRLEYKFSGESASSLGLLCGIDPTAFSGRVGRTAVNRRRQRR